LAVDVITICDGFWCPNLVLSAVVQFFHGNPVIFSYGAYQVVCGSFGRVVLYGRPGCEIPGLLGSPPGLL
jgi:hypothetical protein